MADLLCEELLLLEDDMKLVASLQLPENKEDPYKSNAGKLCHYDATVCVIIFLFLGCRASNEAA